MSLFFDTQCNKYKTKLSNSETHVNDLNYVQVQSNSEGYEE